MPMPFIRIQDIADILIMTFLLYQLYSWFYRTRAMQVLLGLGVVTLIYFVTRFLGLYMTSWILQELGTVLIILLIVVFQSEIRQTLYRFSMLRHLFDRKPATKQSCFQEIAETLFSLASKRIGALLVFERNEPLESMMLNGVRLDCEISPQVLETIFADGTPLHDGAALIREGRISVASCHLPLSVNSEIPQYLGTRHRAALGLSERTDAIVAVVSEERGAVSLAVGPELQVIESPGELIAMLERLITPVHERQSLLPHAHFFSNLLPKTAILLVVITFWALITSRQGQIITVTAPVRMHGISDRLALVRNSPEELEVQLKSFSSLTPVPSKLDIAADIDLSTVREGQATIIVKNSDFKLPSGMEVAAITPSSVKIVTERKERKRVPVKIALRGAAGRGEVIAEPNSVEIEGPVSRLGRIDRVVTEDVDAVQLRKGQEYQKNLLSPDASVTILRDEPIIIRLSVRKKKQ